MKAVVLEIRGAHAAVLQEDGVIVKVEKGSLRVGDTVNVAETVEKETTPSKGFGFGKLIIVGSRYFCCRNCWCQYKKYKVCQFLCFFGY